MGKDFGDDERGAATSGSYDDAVPNSTTATSGSVTITAKGKSHVLSHTDGKTVQGYLGDIPRGERPSTGFLSRTTVMIDGRKASKNDALSAGAVVTITKNTMNG